MNLVEGALRDEGICVTSVEYSPFRAYQLMNGEVAAVMQWSRTRRIVFTTKAPVTDVPGNLELLEANPGALALDIGRVESRGLEESVLASANAGPQARAIARALKRVTRAGALGVHELTGASAHYRSHRYTAGAKALAEEGMQMRPFAQSPVLFRFGE